MDCIEFNKKIDPYLRDELTDEDDAGVLQFAPGIDTSFATEQSVAAPVTASPPA